MDSSPPSRNERSKNSESFWPSASARPLSPSSRAGVRATIDCFFEYIEREPEMYRFVVQSDNRRVRMTTQVFTQQVALLVADAVRAGLALTGRNAAPAEIWGRGIVGMAGPE